jgi:hypothetical protein
MGWHSGQVALLLTHIDLIPAERAQLGDAQPTAVGDPDHGGIAVPVPVLPCSGDQAFDFFGGQGLAGAALGLGALAGAELSHFSDCMVVRAVSLLIARTVSRTNNCPIPGSFWDSSNPERWA